MTTTTPSQPVLSRALDYIKSKKWNYRETEDQVTIEYCPFGRCDGYHLYVAKGGNKDGLFDCKKCGESGNLTKLMAASGDRNDGVMSMRGSGEKEPCPNVDAAHDALLADDEAMEYVATRGLSMDIVDRQKLGILSRRYMKGCGEVKVLAIPHLNNGQPVWMKFRTLPPAEKAFDCLKGWDATLYNEEVITKDMPELIIVEGEMDALTLMSNGVNHVVGVPGANTKKMEWITKLDELKPQRIYILYDSDRVGQRAAQEIAQRIGLDKVMKLILPPFETADGKPGKDINEWFVAGHTLDEFTKLKETASQFDVVGVQNVGQTLDDLEAQILEHGCLKPTYTTPWRSLDQKLGGCEPGDVIDIIAEGKVGKTTLAMNWLDFYVGLGHSSFLYCLEMPNARLGRKWVSYITQSDDTPGQSQITVEIVRAAKAIARERGEAELLFGNNRITKPDDVYDTIRQVVRRYGVKFVCFDNIQLLCDRTLANQNARTVHLSQISKKFKELAMEMNIVIFRIIQPNKVQEGQIVSNKNADGSSQLEKDCDAMIALHRNKKMKLTRADTEAMPFIDEDQAMEPNMFVNVCLSRFAPGGVTTLRFDGATSTVREFDSIERNQAAHSAPKIGLNVSEETRTEA